MNDPFTWSAGGNGLPTSDRWACPLARRCGFGRSASCGLGSINRSAVFIQRYFAQAPSGLFDGDAPQCGNGLQIVRLGFGFALLPVKDRFGRDADEGAKRSARQAQALAVGGHSRGPEAQGDTLRCGLFPQCRALVQAPEFAHGTLQGLGLAFECRDGTSLLRGRLLEHVDILAQLLAHFLARETFDFRFEKLSEGAH